MITTINRTSTQKDIKSTPAVAFLDASDKFIYTNPALSLMLGYSLSDFFEMDMEKAMQFIHPDDRQATCELWQKILNQEIGEFDEQQRLIKKDGTVFWVNKTVKTSWNTEGDRIVTILSYLEIKHKK
jgi:PAS domain S-box-containing protein